MVAIRLAVRIWLLTCVVGICGLTLSAEGLYTAHPCAAFAIDGRSATGTITPTSLQLRVFDASGHSQQTALVYKGTPSDCRIFFPRQGDYLIAAAGLHSGEKQWLRIGALNTDSIKWTSNFSVEPRPGFDSPILAGFLGGGSTLVVMGYKRESSAERSTGVRTVLITARGKVADAPGFVRPEVGDPDTAHNRLWFRSQSDPCWRSVTLTGSLAGGPAFGQRALGGDDPDARRLICEPDTLNLFPDADTVVGAATDSHEVNWVWRTNLGSKDGDKLKLPVAKSGTLTRWGGYDITGSTVSPDGQVVALSRSLTSFDLLDRAKYGNAEIDVIQVTPLRLLGVVWPKRSCRNVDGLAVDHRDGHTTVLAYWCGTWQRTDLLAGIPASPTK